MANSPKTNFSNEAFAKMLRENGASSILKIRLPGHRLPTWNDALSGTRREQMARKRKEKQKVKDALITARADVTGSLFIPFAPDSSTPPTPTSKPSKTSSPNPA